MKTNAFLNELAPRIFWGLIGMSLGNLAQNLVYKITMREEKEDKEEK